MRSSLTVAPVYAVWPASATVIVYRTTDDGVVVLAFAVLVMVRAGIRPATLLEQAAGAAPEAGAVGHSITRTRYSARAPG